MTIILNIFIVAAFSGTVWSLFMLHRDILVFNYRHRILMKVFALGIEDIIKSKGKNPDWRFKAFKKVSYDEMLKNPFRKLDTYWVGYDFNIKL